MSTLSFRFAEEDWEMERIHALNYAAFVEEIPQHPPNDDKRLVDKFHDQNTYGIAVKDRDVVGMVALRKQRPFSLDAKLADLDSYLPDGVSVCEIRLLYIVPAHRQKKVLRGLCELIGAYGQTHQLTLALISGTTRQARLYRHMGFVAFGPLTGKGEAMFQPMYLRLETAIEKTPWAVPDTTRPSSPDVRMQTTDQP